ncbi:hypothetical protein [Borrelia duttonii]|uniref:Uncharacterized conserved protein n=1 Tax=Borrelia duttonii (strain Ly) TaxID=412419 RepID=B5RNF1_BORDL|nr:uncharacterized conserved protein [Borrelia duttonii Ly]
MMDAINLTIVRNMKRYTQPMFLFKKNLIKNRTNFSYEIKIDKTTPIKFDGVFLPSGESNIELFGSNIFVKEIHAKTYTLDILDFNSGEQLLVGNDIMEILSVSRHLNFSLNQRFRYIVLMLRKL